MNTAKVYFTDFHTKPNGRSVLDKLRALLEKSDFAKMDLENKFVAIKIHFGEEGNLSYLRHNYAKVLVDMIKERGGKPFLTDCNTLYVGSRKNALEHLDCAYMHGYNPLTVGCHVIIADGLRGTNETLVPVNCEYVKEARIGSAIMDADVVISLNHFKGHEATGFGGALKNLGMGSGSRAGKMDMHHDGKPKVNTELCRGCGSCERICAHGAAKVGADRKASIDYDKCVGCGRCLGACGFDAVEPTGDNSSKILNCRMAEYAYAVVKDRPNFHISLIMDVSPYCDCHSENDVPIIPDVGIFCSSDPVALDRACVDACNKQPVMPGSAIDGKVHEHDDRFAHTVNPNTEWQSCLEHAKQIGMGTDEYELITLK